MSDSRTFFADELEKLLALPIATETELEAWYGASADLREKLRSEHPDIKFEGETYHFLVDAKIRQRDPGYRHWQEAEVRSYIQQVRATHDINVASYEGSSGQS